MTIPRQRYLSADDIPPQHRGWMTPLVRAMNDHNTDLVKILASGITPQNMRSTIKEVMWNGAPLLVSHDLPAGSKPYAVIVQRCGLGGVAQSVGVPAWDNTVGGVLISGILGTTPGFNYNVRIQILGS